MIKSKPSVVWFQAVSCNGNTHSFLCANSSRLELFFNEFDLIYHPSLTMGVSLDDVLKNHVHIDYLLIEGAITNNTDFYTVSNKSLKSVLNKLASKCTYLINIGSCASTGGIHAMFKENEDLDSVNNSLQKKIKKNLNHEAINLTGCPVHPEWILQTLFTLKYEKKILLDLENRPRDLYNNLAHHGCTRNEYFEWKVEAKGFGLKEGCLFYNEGCRGPMTHSSCNKILWNEVSSKTRAGVPCIGCTETDFPRTNMLETKKNIGIPADVPIGVSKRAYLSITGVAKTFKIKRLNEKLK